ncbi:MAG: hypothetical protein HOH43_13950 [Candidatus Latescibacteria bacterium]|jgi:hypothetical protein|nr:hypothetical protein [Candidatus Latescibacterota bacterium]
MSRLNGIVVTTIALIMLFSSEGFAQRGGFGGGRGGGRGGFDREQMEQMRARAETMQRADVAWLWTVMSFKMDLADDQLVATRQVLKSTWDTKQSYISDAMDRDADWEAMAEEMEEVERLMNKRVALILSEDQRKQLKDLRKHREKMLKSIRPPGR